MSAQANTWTVVLAAGEGSRLRSLTTSSSGTPVPKQFCSLFEGPSLLHDALWRARAVSDPEHICVVVAAQHRRWWDEALSSLPAGNVIVQPKNRGTGNGILLPLLTIAARDPAARLVLLPSDHHVRQEAVLAMAMRAAVAQLDRRPDIALLLGIEPEEADPELGYLLPGTADDSGLLRVARFIEKPSAQQARELIRAGGLWNAFIVISSAQALIALFKRSVPSILEPMRAAIAHDSAGAAAALAALYERLPVVDFSRDVLCGRESMLRVLPVPRCGWSDLGTPKRVAQAVRAIPGGLRSPWAGVGIAQLSLAAQHSRRLLGHGG
jgi:mannose-1-phosphate guanylyltransferase